MPRTKSALKALRQNKRRRVQNISRQKKLKTVLKKSSDLSAIYKAVDKAAKVNLIKKNKANRLKSQLAKKLARASA